MADKYINPDKAFDRIHQTDYEVLKELNGISTSVNLDKTNKTTSNNRKRYYEVLHDDSILSTSNKKHSYEELFDDISDFLETDSSVNANVEPRKKKLRWDQPEDVIKKIWITRHLLDDNGEAAVKINYDHKKNSISLRVPSWNFVAITRSYDSQRLYIKVRNISKDINQSRRPITNLLSMPYSQLKIQAEEIMIRKQKLSGQSFTIKNIINDELWVDKYRPRSYLDLLSDETINRQFLHWLKLWDKIVFNQNALIPRKKQPSTYEKKNNIDDEKDIGEVDNKGYPIKRIALLSGPPGLGKTTLAHIAAKHAGYNVVEINASDERTPDTFRQILLASTEMKAVMGADPRPNCLIFDEIDGAPAASIELLLKFIQGKLVPKSKKGTEQSEKMFYGCTRPIICICNELYTPSLRILKAAAVIFLIQEVNPLRLAERLMDLVRKEKLNIDFGDLIKIAERYNCDVRACIGALQYIGSANLKYDLSLSLKDTRKNLFDLWKSILTFPMNKGKISISERIQNILRIVQNGEIEKISQGIFHNYPEICDWKLDNISISLEWFQFFDSVTSLIAYKQIWSLMPYTNYGFIAWHLYLAQTQKIKLSYPSVTNEVIQKSAKNMSILMAIQKVYGCDIFTLTTDIISFLPDILTPRLRTVPSHLYSPKEKLELARIINVMLEFGLSFIQEKNPQGGYMYKLDPNILEVGILPDCNVHRRLAYAVQQIIAQELEVERLKRANSLTGLDGIRLKNMTNSEKPEIIESIQNKFSNSLNSMKQPKKNMTLLKDRVHKDFFANIMTNKNENAETQNKLINSSLLTSQKRCTQMQNILTKHGIWYKYKEGCNNAVRRSVFMEKFL